MARRVELGWGLAAALMLLAGCGGSSSSDQTAQFKSSLPPVADQLRETAQGIAGAIQRAPSQTDAQIAVAFHQLAARWQTHLSELQTLKPPAKLAADFNTLTGAAARVEADLNAVAVAASTHSKAAAEQASGSLVTDILSAKSASTTITDQLGVK